MKLVYKVTGTEVKPGDRTTTLDGDECTIVSIDYINYIVTVQYPRDTVVNQPDLRKRLQALYVGAQWVEETTPEDILHTIDSCRLGAAQEPAPILPGTQEYNNLCFVVGAMPLTRVVNALSYLDADHHGYDNPDDLRATLIEAAAAAGGLPVEEETLKLSGKMKEIPLDAQGKAIVTEQAIIVSGDPASGFTFTGPFINKSAAEDWGSDNDNGDTWWIAPLVAPT